MFPPSLYTYVRSLGKDMIVVLNKVDLVPPSLAIAWKHALIDKYPELQVTFFSSCPSYNLRVGLKEDQSGLKYRRMRGKIRMVTEGAEQVWKACQHFGKKYWSVNAFLRTRQSTLGSILNPGRVNLHRATFVVLSPSMG